MLHRLARVVEGRWALPTLIGLNTLAVLCFRHFVSLDGPMHLLHAAVLHDSWAGHPRTADGFTVDTDALDLNLGDLPLIALAGQVHPFLLHKLLAALAITCISTGAWCLARAYSPRPSAAWLLVLPFAFGFLLVLGVFHFAIGAGIAMGLCGWWAARPVVRWREVIVLAAGCALATFAHNTGGLLTLLLIGTHEVFARWCGPVAWRARWSGLPPRVPLLLALAVAITGAVLVALRFAVPVAHPHLEHHPLLELATLRQILLVDREAEFPYRLTLGGLLMVLLVLAVRARFRTRALRPADALLAMAGLLFLLSLVRTPRTELHFATDRAQWLGLLLLACWLGAQDQPGRAMPLVLLGILTVHGLRLGFVEQWMHWQKDKDGAAVDASRSFHPGALVMPLVLDDDWLARHRTAYAAIGYTGIMFTPRDHLRFRSARPLDRDARKYLNMPDNDTGHAVEHLREGRFPVPGQVLVLSPPVDTLDRRWAAARAVLAGRYVRAVAGDHAQVWALRGPADGR